MSNKIYKNIIKEIKKSSEVFLYIPSYVSVGDKLWVNKFRDRTGKTFTIKSNVELSDKEIIETLSTMPTLINQDGTLKRDFEIYSYKGARP